MIYAVSLDADDTLYRLNREAGLKGLCEALRSEFGESYEFWETEYNKVREYIKRNIPPTDIRYQYVAFRIREMLRTLNLDVTRSREFANFYYVAELDATTFYSQEVSELIKVVKRHSKVGITTDSQFVPLRFIRDGRIPPIWEKAGINIGDLDFLIRSFRFTKVSGIPFRRLVDYSKGYGIKPSEILHVGDSIESDITPAEREGIKALLFNPKEQTFDELMKELNVLLAS